MGRATHRHEDLWRRTLDDFLALKRPRTQVKYAEAAAEWVKFLAAKDILKATDGDAARWAKKLEDCAGYGGTRLSRSTVYHKLAVVKQLYAILQEQGKVKHNPLSHVLQAYRGAQNGNGLQKRPTELVPLHLVPKILVAPPDTTKEGRRDRCYLALLFGCALRNGEAAALTVGDVRATKSGELALFLRQTKNHTDAIQPVPSSVRAAIEAYVQTRRDEGATATDPLLVAYYAHKNPSRRHIDQRQLQRLFGRWMSECGVPGRVTPHSARATAITLLLEMGLPHREVRKFSRHSSIAMVERYDKLRDVGAEVVAQQIDYSKKIGND